MWDEAQGFALLTKTERQKETVVVSPADSHQIRYRRVSLLASFTMLPTSSQCLFLFSDNLKRQQ